MVLAYLLKCQTKDQRRQRVLGDVASVLLITHQSRRGVKCVTKREQRSEDLSREKERNSSIVPLEGVHTHRYHI
jgi:hypothetical protein